MEEILSRMQGLELLAPPLLAVTDLSPACEQPLSPPTPPRLVHKFPELEDTTGQARRIQRATAGWSYRLGSQVLCRVVSASLLTISSTSTATSSTTTITGFTNTMPSTSVPPINSLATLVCESRLFSTLHYGMYDRRLKWNLVCCLCAMLGCWCI